MCNEQWQQQTGEFKPGDFKKSPELIVLFRSRRTRRWG